MGLIIDNQAVTRIELDGVEVLKIEDSNGNVLYESYSGPDYLCFTAGAANSTIEFTSSAPTLYTSSDRRNWTKWDGSRITLANAGDKVYVYGNNPSGISTQTNWRRFRMTGLIAASGDVTTLITQNGGVTVLPDYCFTQLFQECSSLTSVPSLDSVTRVNQWALSAMFYECTSITEAPDLRNVTYVGSYGCASMYYGCTALRTIYAPSIDTWTKTNFTGWVTGIGGSGVMWKPAALSIPSGNDGKPSGWSTQDYD